MEWHPGDIVQRLRFDATRCWIHFSMGVARNIDEAADEIERLRAEVAMWKDLAQPREPSSAPPFNGDFS